MLKCVGFHTTTPPHRYYSCQWINSWGLCIATLVTPLVKKNSNQDTHKNYMRQLKYMIFLIESSKDKVNFNTVKNAFIKRSNWIKLVFNYVPVYKPEKHWHGLLIFLPSQQIHWLLWQKEDFPYMCYMWSWTVCFICEKCNILWQWHSGYSHLPPKYSSIENITMKTK